MSPHQKSNVGMGRIEKNEILGCSKIFSPLSCGLFVVKLIRGEEGIERGVNDSKTVDSSLFILLFRI